jgi:hypothetical protein
MDVRNDYETQDILAVFDSREAADEAVQRVIRVIGDRHRVKEMPLAPGRYQLADISLQEVVHGAVRAVTRSVPLGALAGAGLAVAAVPGVGPLVLAAMAFAGAIGGFVVGSMTGAIASTRWDRDPAPFIDVPPSSHYRLVIVEASPAPAWRETSKVLRILARGGAIGFLDPTAYYAEHEPDAAKAVVGSNGSSERVSSK